MTTLHDFTATRLDGTDERLADYAGRHVLVVNTASECGLTPQYAGLEELFRTYAGHGFTVLGFPCNQFGAQEPGSAREIADFCRANYGVTFPMFAKVDVNGEHAHPLFVWLKRVAPEGDGSDIEWNFAKFLVSPDGEVVHRYSPRTTPAEVVSDLETALGHTLDPATAPRRTDAPATGGVYTLDDLDTDVLPGSDPFPNAAPGELDERL